MRTFQGAAMRDSLSGVLVTALLCVLAKTANAGHLRRSMQMSTTLPLSKGGWRPVINSGLPGFGLYGAPSIHPPSYKIPVPVQDNYPSSTRPVSKDTNKINSIVQSYRPTTLRTLPSSSPADSMVPHQPVNSYYNPFGISNNGLTHYKFVQNHPVDNVILRNPHNPYHTRPYKYPNKVKHVYQNSMIPAMNLQMQFGQYQHQKQQERPIDMYLRPDKRPGTQEVQDVYKSPDDASPQSANQQVKTAQQQGQVKPVNFPHYQYKDEKYAPIPPSLLGTFNSFGMQSVKGRDQFYTPQKTTYIQNQPTKQTLFNSFSFTPNYKTSINYPQTTTTKVEPQNPINFVTLPNNNQIQGHKPSRPQKNNNENKVGFKPSPQDPFSKLKPDLAKVPVSTYKPNVQHTASINNYNYNQPSQYHHQSVQTAYYNQPSFQYENKKHKIHDSVTPTTHKHLSTFPTVYKKKPDVEPTQDSLPRPATYEVTENYDSDPITQSSPYWSSEADTGDYEKRPVSEESFVHDSEIFYKQTTTTPSNVPEDYAIVTESDKGYGNSLNYDSPVETQSRRPLGDDFEPINKNKLKDYYYKVSTPSYEEFTPHYKRKIKTTEEPPTSSISPVIDTTTLDILSVKPLPTLPPNKHFKRPGGAEAFDKEKVRKRIKNRRRRPGSANHSKEDQKTSNIRASTPSNEDSHTSRPRVRLPKPRPVSGVTTPTVTTDNLSTSVIPTTSPTSPTSAKKKVSNRSRLTTPFPERFDSTASSKESDSSIMKIATRPLYPRVTTYTSDYKPTELPDYTHKQDEQDTPTSDTAVTPDVRDKTESTAFFSFHKDVQPIEAKLEPINSDTTTEFNRNTEYDDAETTTSTPVTENTDTKSQRNKIKGKYESTRPKFSVKEYRNRLSSTTSTSTTDRSTEPHTTRLRFPQRRLPSDNKSGSENENITERKKFVPKDARHKVDDSTTEVPTRQTIRQRPETETPSTQKISSRIRGGSRRPRPEETTEPLSPTTHIKRPQRKKVKDSELSESVQDITVTETVVKEDSSSEKIKSESAIMKIAKDDKKHQPENIDLFEHSKRVSDLTLAASKDYNNPGLFKTMSPNSRRIPSYFTIATDDPILPIEAFFPQLNQKKET